MLCDCIFNRKQKIAKKRKHQHGEGDAVELPWLAGLVLHNYRNIAIEKKYHSHHAAEEKPVHHIVQKKGHCIKVIYRVYGYSIKKQVGHNTYNQPLKGLV